MKGQQCSLLGNLLVKFLLNLDENWIEDKLRYRLVRALIETVRDFNKIKCVKIIVSVRYDLLQRIFKVTRDAGYQEEKYDSMYLKLNWSKHYLGSLLDERINHLIQQRYTSQKVSYHDIMPNKIKKIDPLDYILERTFMRPRDLISFLNYCIQKSEDSPIISPKTIQNAEHEYSRFRLRSLADEWFADYPNLLEYAMILKGKPSHFQLSLLRKEDVEDFCLALSITKPEYNDDLSYAGSQVATGECHVEDFKKILIKVFYIVGLIGVKLEAYEQYGWSYNLPRYFADTEVDGTTKIAIHPMFYRAMGIKAS